MPTTLRKVYLGDGAYVQRGPWGASITLTTENGVSTTNTIVLEPYGIELLLLYIKELKQYLKENE